MQVLCGLQVVFFLFNCQTPGLTGIKSIVFNAYEDIILLVCGLFGVI